MSGLLLPIVAVGGVYLLYDAMTKKHKHRGHSASSTRSHSPSSGSSTKSHNKSVSDSRDYSEVLHVKNKQTRKRSDLSVSYMYIIHTEQ